MPFDEHDHCRCRRIGADEKRGIGGWAMRSSAKLIKSTMTKGTRKNRISRHKGSG